MATHILKIYPEYFNEILSGKKRFEILRNDRKFKVKDYLFLREMKPETLVFTGRQIAAFVTHIFTPEMYNHNFGIMFGYCVMSIRVEVGVYFQNEQIAGRSVYDFDNKGRLRK